jgi:hypothetical protein
MTKPQEPKKGGRTEPVKEEQRTKVVPEPNDTRTGQAANIRQNTTNKGTQQDR